MKLKMNVMKLVYEEQCGMMEMVFEVDEIKEEVGNIRKEHTKFND